MVCRAQRNDKAELPGGLLPRIGQTLFVMDKNDNIGYCRGYN